MTGRGEVVIDGIRATWPDGLQSQEFLRVLHVVGGLRFPGHSFYLAQRGTVVYLRVEAMLPNNIEGGEPELQRGRPWLLRPGADAGEIVRTAWLAIETFLIHEAREQFTYRGERVMYPHFKVN